MREKDFSRLPPLDQPVIPNRLARRAHESKMRREDPAQFAKLSRKIKGRKK